MDISTFDRLTSKMVSLVLYMGLAGSVGVEELPAFFHSRTLAAICARGFAFVHSGLITFVPDASCDREWQIIVDDMSCVLHRANIDIKTIGREGMMVLFNEHMSQTWEMWLVLSGKRFCYV